MQKNKIYGVKCKKLLKNLVFPKNILILQMSMIFINVMEGKVHGISSFPTVPPLHPFFKKGKETEKGETIK